MKASFKNEIWRFLLAARTAIFKLFQITLRAIRIDAFIRKQNYHYVPDYFGRAAHKQRNIRLLPQFGELAAEVVNTGRSSLYYDRLHTIYQLILQLNVAVKSGQKINLAEVGVYKGGTSYFIAALAHRLKLNITHCCFDTFEGHAAQDIDLSVETSHKARYFNDTSYESVRDYLSRFKNVDVYKGRFQDTCHYIQDTPIHFVHLDMDIYEPTIFALKFFDKRVVNGGMILVDDYGFESCPGIEKAVAEFTSVNSQYFGMALLTGQYILI